MEEKIRQRFEDDTEAVIAAFKQAYPKKELINLLSTDSMVREKTLEFCMNRVKTGNAPVYNYMFAYTFPYRLGRPAWHCAEIPFVFKNTVLDEATSSGGIDIPVMENFMSAAWVAFARTGCPDNRFLPDWIPLTPENHATMIFDTYPTVRTHFDDTLTELLKAHPPVNDPTLINGLN